MTVSEIGTTDVLNSILGIDDDAPIARLRNQKPTLVKELQDYYLSLFEPTTASAKALPVDARYVVAVRVASHTGSTAVVDWYANLASEAGVAEATIEQARDVAGSWSDSTPLASAIRHADLLTTRPADATREDLEALKAAGYSPAGIVSLSQVIAFVSYQLRLAAGLRALGGLK
jgi:CMD domain protein